MVEIARAALIAVVSHEAAGEKHSKWSDTYHASHVFGESELFPVQRWGASNAPRTSVVLYDLPSIGDLKSDIFRGMSEHSPWPGSISGEGIAVRDYEAIQRNPGHEPLPTNANALFIIGMNVEDSIEEEFNAWYDEEHLPRLGALAGVASARRYVTARGPHKYVAVYHLDNPFLVGSASWLEATETPWTHRVRPRTFDRFKLICRRRLPTAFPPVPVETSAGC